MYNTISGLGSSLIVCMWTVESELFMLGKTWDEYTGICWYIRLRVRPYPKFTTAILKYKIHSNYMKQCIFILFITYVSMGNLIFFIPPHSPQEPECCFYRSFLHSGSLALRIAKDHQYAEINREVTTSLQAWNLLYNTPFIFLDVVNRIIHEMIPFMDQ